MKAYLSVSSSSDAAAAVTLQKEKAALAAELADLQKKYKELQQTVSGKGTMISLLQSQTESHNARVEEV